MNYFVQNSDGSRKESAAMARNSKNPNHPRKGSVIKVEPLRNLDDIRKIKNLLANNKRDLCLFTVGINTAYRASELVSIRVGQVTHLEPGDTLTVRQPKNGALRTVTINHAAHKAIQGWLEEHPASDQPFAPLFPSRTTGRALKSNTVSKYMKRWCRVAEVPGNYASHTMRKTFGFHVYRSNHSKEPGVTSHPRIGELMLVYGNATERQTLTYLCIQEQEISEMYMAVGL